MYNEYLQNASRLIAGTMEKQAHLQKRSECVVSNTLDILGDKWTLLVIRDILFFDKHEYKEFLASPEAIATNILSERLQRLLQAEIVAVRLHPQNKSRKLYYLTDKGKGLLPVLLEIASWGADHLPELAAMQNLYKRVREDREGLKAEILERVANWERLNLLPS